MTIVGLKTLHELRGISCFSLEEHPKPRQSISVSRSFGKKVTDIQHAKEALADYVSIAAAKLRSQNSLTTHIIVFAVTSRYRDPQNYFTSAQAQLPMATDYTPHLIAVAHNCLNNIFKRGSVYSKVGVLFSDIAPADSHQMSILSPGDTQNNKHTKFMKVVDRINTKWGRGKLFFAAIGIKKSWKMKQAHKSACFTTNWHEILTIDV